MDGCAIFLFFYSDQNCFSIMMLYAWPLIPKTPQIINNKSTNFTELVHIQWYSITSLVVISGFWDVRTARGAPYCALQLQAHPQRAR